MSKKSRKRNKKILAAIGIGLGAAALASRNKRNASIQANETKEAGSAETGKKFEDQSYSTGPKKDTTKKTDYITKKDTSTSTGKKYRSRMLRPNSEADGKVMGPGETAIFNAKNKMPDMAPPSIDNPYNSRVIKGRFGDGKKDGGRMGLKSGGKVKGCGKALRGFGKAMKGKR